MKHTIRGVLFDLDGTLLDTYDLILESLRYTMRKVLDESYSAQVLMAKVGQPLATQMWDFTSDPAVHEELLQVYRAYNAKVHDSLIKEFPGTNEALEALRRAGYPMGVVTSKRHEPAVTGLSRFNMGEYFECLIGSDDWPTHKPDPGPVVHGCDVLGLAPAECLYVGDSPFDLQAGKGAGCATASVAWGMFPPDVLAAEHPNYHFNTIQDLVDLLGA